MYINAMRLVLLFYSSRLLSLLIALLLHVIDWWRIASHRNRILHGTFISDANGASPTRISSIEGDHCRPGSHIAIIGINASQLFGRGRSLPQFDTCVDWTTL